LPCGISKYNWYYWVKFKLGLKKGANEISGMFYINVN